MYRGVLAAVVLPQLAEGFVANKHVVVVAPTARLAVYDPGGDGEPLLLLHGGPGCPDYLGPIAAMLPNTYRAIRFDQRGVGRSVAHNRRYEIEDYLSDLGAIRTYFGFEKMHLLGHSWGGLLAQLYARQQPERVRSLVLCNSALGVGEDWQRTERAVIAHNQRKAGRGRSILPIIWSLALRLPGSLGKFGAKKVFATIWRNCFQDPRKAFPPDPTWLDGVNGEALEKTSKALAAAKSNILQTPAQQPKWPVLIVYGQQGYDIFGSGVDIVHSRFPTAWRVVLQNAGHLPWLQDRDAFNDNLTGFYKFL